MEPLLQIPATASSQRWLSLGSLLALAIAPCLEAAGPDDVSWAGGWWLPWEVVALLLLNQHDKEIKVDDEKEIREGERLVKR